MWEAEVNAWRSLAQGKFSLFGYWAAKVVQFRELLGRSHDPSPFRELVKVARENQVKQSIKQGWGIKKEAVEKE